MNTVLTSEMRANISFFSISKSESSILVLVRSLGPLSPEARCLQLYQCYLSTRDGRAKMVYNGVGMGLKGFQVRGPYRGGEGAVCSVISVVSVPGDGRAKMVDNWLTTV